MKKIGIAAIVVCLLSCMLSSCAQADLSEILKDIGAGNNAEKLLKNHSSIYVMTEYPYAYEDYDSEQGVYVKEMDDGTYLYYEYDQTGYQSVTTSAGTFTITADGEEQSVLFSGDEYEENIAQKLQTVSDAIYLYRADEEIQSMVLVNKSYVLKTNVSYTADTADYAEAMQKYGISQGEFVLNYEYLISSKTLEFSEITMRCEINDETEIIKHTLISFDSEPELTDEMSALIVAA